MTAMRPVRCSAALAGAAAAFAIGGCGSERTPVPAVNQPVTPQGLKTFRTKDVRFRYPANWTLVRPDAPAVAHVLSGRSVLTVWAYRRPVVPSTLAQTRTARRNLVRTVRRRDKTFKLVSSRVRMLDNARAVEILGYATISGNRVRIRSVHLYKRLGEYVLDAYAPLSQFTRVDRPAFRPIIATFHARGRPAKVREPGTTQRSTRTTRTDEGE
jgi:hypothetical protein